MSSTSTGVRKRLLSNPDEAAVAESRKKPRTSLGASASFSGALSVTSWLDRLPKPRTPLQLHRDATMSSFASRRGVVPPPSLSRASSFTAGGSRACSPGASTVTGVPSEYDGGSSSKALIAHHSGMALMRSVSTASLRSSSPSTPSYPECSAKWFLRSAKTTIDFSLPTSSSATAAATTPGATTSVDDTTLFGRMGIGLAGLQVLGLAPPPATPPLVVSPTTPTANGTAVQPSLLSCSTNNTLLFTRGNRVHYKNITSNEEVGQLCKLQESHGDVQIICCAGSDQPDVVALGTSTGLIQIWDLKAKKKISSWSTKGVSSMRWNGATLTVGGLKGTIRHYDTRINPTLKMKEQSRKVTRHQARITSLDWSVEGTLLASGDESGTVYCWDSRQKVPLDVGEFVQRRKKMQHEGCVRALAWCPWQPKLLASGDERGVVRLWNVNANNTHSNAAVPGKLELGASVTGIHFSPHCKEFLTTHGTIPVPPTPTRASHYSPHSTPNHSHLSTLSGLLTPTSTSTPTSSSSQNTLVWPATPTTNCIAVHAYPSLRQVTTMSVADNPIEGSVMNPLGTKIVVSVPADGKLHLCDVWQKRKEVKRQPSFMNSSTIR